MKRQPRTKSYQIRCCLCQQRPCLLPCTKTKLSKYATGALSEIHGRDNITIGTWNTKTLRAAGKLQQLAHKKNRYRWNILGLCKVRCKNFGKKRKKKKRGRTNGPFVSDRPVNSYRLVFSIKCRPRHGFWRTILLVQVLLL